VSWELEQEAQRKGFILTEHWDKQTGTTTYTIEQMSPEDLAAFLAVDQQEEP
jgi:hypothetical protein